MELEKLIESERAYRILRQIIEENSTPTEIAKELDTSSNSISNYLRDLSKAGLVKKSEPEGRKQPYQFNAEGHADLTMAIIWSKLLPNPSKEDLTYENLNDFIPLGLDIIEETTEERNDNDIDFRIKLFNKLLKSVVENEEQFRTFVGNYFAAFISNVEIATIGSMVDQLIDNFAVCGFRASDAPISIETIGVHITLMKTVNENEEGYQAVQYAINSLKED